MRLPDKGLRAFRPSIRFVVLVVACMICVGTARADFISIGILSFDQVIPGSPGSPGVNQFTAFNASGSGVFIPGALDSLTFSSATLTLTGSGGTQVINLADILAGGSGTSSLFPDTDTFSEALFQGTLSNPTFNIDGGFVFTANSNSVSADLLAPPATELEAGTDLTTIDIEGTISQPVTTVPEPATLTFIALASPYLLRKIHGRRSRQ